MAIDETGLRIFVLTSSGLTIVQLDSLPLSLGNVTPSAGPSSGGVAVTLRGSGFQAGSKVMFGGTALSVTFVDPDTIQLVSPQTPNVYVARYFAGSNRRTLTIPKKKSGEFNAQVASGEKSQR